MTSLNRLDLRHNRFRRFPQILLAFPNLKIDLEFKDKNPGVKEKVVFLEGNPIEDVPREVMENGMKSVRAYLSAMDKVV